MLTYARQLEAKQGIASSQWFEEERIMDADYPSGEAIRTKIYEGRCVFYDRKARGCALHRFAAEEGMDWHLLKPMVCSIFPITWGRGRLFLSGFLNGLFSAVKNHHVREIKCIDARDAYCECKII